MDYLAYLLVVALIIGSVFWGADRHLCLKDAGKDLHLHLGDLLVLRDASEPQLRVHFEAQIAMVKELIRKHCSL